MHVGEKLGVPQRFEDWPVELALKGQDSYRPVLKGHSQAVLAPDLDVDDVVDLTQASGSIGASGLPARASSHFRISSSRCKSAGVLPRGRQPRPASVA